MVSQHIRYLNRGVVALASLALAASCTLAQADPSGIEFVTITHAGNAPYQSIFPQDFVNGRGGVDYEYRLGKFEVTTAQWVEFFNAAYDRSQSDWLPHLRPPDFWGAAPTTPNTPGGRRWSVPAGNDMRPVGDISWRMAAMYCNWLHNDKSTDRSAFMNGAYDVSTFGFNGGIFTDQLARHPDARYWIPTWDEWLKAAHYDPNKTNGDGTTGGWWQYSNGSDTPYVYGPPPSMGGGGEANAGFTTPSPFAIPLGSYATVSPWGLYDMAGGTTEWTESSVTSTTGQRTRIFDGSWWGQNAFVAGLMEQVREQGAEFPHVPTYEHGLRIASVVPAASTCAPAGVCLGLLCARRRRPMSCVDSTRR